jgi:fructosamine-3-kinase
MLTSIPKVLQVEIQTDLSRILSVDLVLEDFKFSSGGCINNTGVLQSNRGSFFIKWNTKFRFPKMFALEKHGLSRLKSASHNLKIPDVIQSGETDSHIYLLLENISSAEQKPNYWELLGSGLAQLHQNKSDVFGLEEDNYIGSLVQYNNQNPNWIEFFINQRLIPNFKMAYDSGYFNNKHKKSLNNLEKSLPDICPDVMQVSLLHGDLWSGNLMIDGNGYPALIDPAVYYGYREIEIAFTELFGRFGQAFYDSYEEAWPLEVGYKERIDIWNLYPLLVHVNLFGKSYVKSVLQILNKFE